MKIAVITGASSGIGREFARRARDVFPQIECIWLVARRRERLEQLRAELEVPAEVLPLDLCAAGDRAALEEKLAQEKPEVLLLVNSAGCGFLGDVADTDAALLSRSIELNVRALTEVTRAVLPYVPDGGRIVNLSSIASFCPTPRMSVYSATKSYVSAFSLGLREELRPRKINVTAVCPGPMKTEFLDVGGITGKSTMFQKLPQCGPEKTALAALRAARRGRCVWTPKVFFKFYRVVAKVIPHILLVKFVKI